MAVIMLDESSWFMTFCIIVLLYNNKYDKYTNVISYCFNEKMKLDFHCNTIRKKKFETYYMRKEY